MTDDLDYMIHCAEFDHHEARLSALAAKKSRQALADAVASGQLSPEEMAKAGATLAAIQEAK